MPVYGHREVFKFQYGATNIFLIQQIVLEMKKI